MPTILRIAALGLILLTAACGGADDPGGDASTDAGRDARAVDSGHDGAIVDSGHDGAIVDTGVVDSNVPTDSGGPMDAGFDACPGTSLTATADQLCAEFCGGNVVMLCGGPTDGGCIPECLTAHADGVKTATQRGNMLACAQAIMSANDCQAFGACYTLASSCP